ncbi:MAG: hypothetical protein K8H74_10705 [Notoacmeibacter sp.]|nr:hypothetical protein [Notoacmeibacter sp.]
MSGKPKDQWRPERGKTNGGGSNVVRLPNAVAEQIAEAERQRAIVAGIRPLEIAPARRRSGLSKKEKREAAALAKEFGGTIEIERNGTVFRFSAGVAPTRKADFKLI